MLQFMEERCAQAAGVASVTATGVSQAHRVEFGNPAGNPVQSSLTAVSAPTNTSLFVAHEGRVTCVPQDFRRPSSRTECDDGLNNAL